MCGEEKSWRAESCGVERADVRGRAREPGGCVESRRAEERSSGRPNPQEKRRGSLDRSPAPSVFGADRRAALALPLLFPSSPLLFFPFLFPFVLAVSPLSSRNLLLPTCLSHVSMSCRTSIDFIMKGARKSSFTIVRFTSMFYVRETKEQEFRSFKKDGVEKTR